MEEITAPSTCDRCGKTFSCGAANGEPTCWCQDLPKIMPTPQSSETCLCPDCLREEIQRRES